MAEHVSLFDISERMLMETMSSSDCYPEKNVYCWEIGALEVHRCGKMSIFIEIDKKYCSDNKKLCLFSRDYNIRTPHYAKPTNYELSND